MIVITGGAGFIGSCLLHRFNVLGVDDIIIVDNLGSTAKWKNLLNKRYDEIFGKEEFLEKIKQNYFAKTITSIYHLGACTDTTETDSNYLLSNNYNYSKTLAKFALEKDIPFFYASSAATYGLGEFGYVDNIFEELRPINAYGFSKHIFDLWVLKNSYDQYFTGLKFFNVFGPNEYHKNSMASMVYKSYHQIKNEKKIKLFKSNDVAYADGMQSRDFIYVKDVTNIIMKLYKNKAKGIFNVGTGIASSWNDLANSVFTSLEIEPNIEYIDMPENLANQYQNFTQADLTKLTSTIGNFEFTSLEDSVSDYLLNYLNTNSKYL